MKPTTQKNIVHWLLVAAGLIIVQSAVACADEPGDTLTAKIDCWSYCRQAETCNGDVNRAQCENDCREALNECRADEVDEAQEQLDECAKESCDEFVGCTIEAGAQCYFGLSI
jgi:hypothetical protein